MYTTIKNLLQRMNQEKNNFYLLIKLFILARKLPKKMINETIQAIHRR